MSSRTDLLVRISSFIISRVSASRISAKSPAFPVPPSPDFSMKKKPAWLKSSFIVRSTKSPAFRILVRTTFGLRDAVIVAGDYEFDQSLTRWRTLCSRFSFDRTGKQHVYRHFIGAVHWKHCAMSSNRPIIPTTIM